MPPEEALIKVLTEQLTLIENHQIASIQARRQFSVCLQAIDGRTWLWLSARVAPRIKSLETIISTFQLPAELKGQLKAIKCVGPDPLIGEWYDALQAQCPEVPVSKHVSSPDYELFWYQDSGRLRLREMPKSPARPVEPTAAALEVSTTEKRPPLAPDSLRRKIRVMIVDDSRTMRDLLNKILSVDEELEVISMIDHPLKVIPELAKTLPDVMTLDVNMPQMDGITLLEKFLPQYPIPVVLISAVTMEEGNQILRGLELGAVDYVQKPQFKELEQAAIDIRQKVKNAAAAKVKIKSSAMLPNSSRLLAKAPVSQRSNDRVIAIGASTGGTEAIKIVLESFQAPMPPIVIVQHIPPVFSTAFAKRLNEHLALDVKEAEDGDELKENLVLIAPGGLHMEVHESGGRRYVKVFAGANVTGHKPSVDVLFQSMAKTFAQRGIGVILTGMGKDGAQGLLQMQQAGADTIGQDEASCVVYGMPHVAFKLGAVNHVATLTDIPTQIMKSLSQKRAKKAS